MAYPPPPPPPGYGYQQPPGYGYQQPPPSAGYPGYQHPPPTGYPGYQPPPTTAPGPIIRPKPYYYYLTSCLNGFVIDIPGEGTEPTRVCTNPKRPVRDAKSQLWFLDDAGEGYFYIVSKIKSDASLVLDIEGKKRHNDAFVKTYHRKREHKPIEERANQMWRVDPDGTIVSAMHGKVLDVKGRKTLPGTPIVMFDKKPAHKQPENQQWRLEPVQ